MRIGVIADTHGVLHPRVSEVFRGVDHIVHAGDVGGEHVLDALREIAPVTFVDGNNDGASGYEVKRLTLDGCSILLTHILPRPSSPGDHVRRSMATEPADVVVFGHSHLPHDEVIESVTFFNPASAGRRRFDYPTAVGIFERGRPGWRRFHVPLDERSLEALRLRMNQL
jgi:putative phosphoesterase